LISALALVAYLVQPGDTLSGIAASHGATLAAVEAANPQIPNFDVIYAGQSIKIPQGSAAAQSSYAPRSSWSQGIRSQSEPVRQSAPVQQSATPYSAPSSTTGSANSAGAGNSTGTADSAGTANSTGTGSTVIQSSSGSGSTGYSSGSLSDIPGVPRPFAACVAYRESTNLQNPAANGNAYGIIPASGYNVSGTSLAGQKQVFAQLYHQYGSSPWASDGC
jgi:hypothetical protein